MPTTEIPVVNGVVSLYGYGVKVYISGSHLVCEDGICEDRRQGRFHRAASSLRRLAILSTDGFITLAALEWLHDIGASVVQIAGNGDVLLASASPGCDYPRLRRLQALAAYTPAGPAIVRRLLQQKLEGQASVLSGQGFTSQAAEIAGLRGQLDSMAEASALRAVESQAASLYWQTLAGLPVNFVKRKRAGVPEHWRSIGPRCSLLSNGPRNATSPAQALVNYVYGILESETRIALLTMGLDPGLGLLHTDQHSAAGMAYDVMEPARPHADRLVLDLLRSQVFTREDFGELLDGEVRLALHLRARLSDQAHLLRTAVAPFVEQVARDLQQVDPAAGGTPATQASERCGGFGGKSPRPRPGLPTPLTQANRRRGRRRRAEREEDEGERAGKSSGRLDYEPRCRSCGAAPSPGCDYCESCSSQARQEQVALFTKAGGAALGEARARGADPAHGGEAAAKRGATRRRQAQERAEWEAEHPDAESFEEQFELVRAKIVSLPIGKIASALQVSPRYASLIRAGKRPHPMYIARLMELAQDRPGR